MTEVRTAKKAIERETMQASPHAALGGETVPPPHTVPHKHTRDTQESLSSSWQEAQAMVDRLTCDEVQRLTALSQDVDVLRREMEEAHTLAQRTAAVCERCEPLQVISAHDDVLTACQRMAEKPVKKQIAIDDTGFPEEMKARNSMAERYGELEKLIGVKDTIIWSLVEERDELKREKEEAQAMLASSKGEMHEWVQLNDKYCHELRRFLSKCRFCEVVLTPDTVNEDCECSEDGRHFFDPIEFGGNQAAPG